MLEHGAYTLLMQACYDREQFPTESQAIDWCWARTDEETAAVRFVLNKFFHRDGNEWIQDRILEEIEKYHENASTNKRIAQEREERRRKNKARTVHEPLTDGHEPPPNQEPLTTNQEPKTKGSGRASRFTPPSVDDVAAYCNEKNYGIDPERFCDFYESKGWMVGKNKMKDWKATVRNWAKEDKAKQPKAGGFVC